MNIYKSQYTGQQIDSFLNQALTAASNANAAASNASDATDAANEAATSATAAAATASSAAEAANTAVENIQTDLDAKADKAVPSAAGNVALLSADGDLQDSGVNIDYMPSYYGIEWDSSVSSPACTRIGRMDLHVSLPIQSKMRRCILQDDGTVAYYLDANDSTKSETGAAAKLDGTDGQVMVEIPAHYRKFEVEGTKYRCLLSECALPGFHYVPLAYRSAYEAAVDRTVSATPKLASVVNTSAAFRGGNNNAEWDGTYRSLLGLPATYTNLTNFRAYARNRGIAGKNCAGWNCDVYDVQKTCWWLYAVEYANFNCQLDYNAEPTSEGYKQGGLSQGVTTLYSSLWDSYNSYYPFIPCGITNTLGNKTGIVEFTMPDEYDPGVPTTISVPSYRGLENPFGHIWSCTDGCKCNIQSDAEGGLSEFFVCSDPSKFQSNDYTSYEQHGTLPREGGYIQTMMLGEHGDNMPAEIGASASTYFCDYFYTSLPSSGENQMGVIFGGYANNNTSAGLLCSYVSNPSSISANVGSRLCFLPALHGDEEILPSQISPLQGRQTGVNTSNGYFNSTAPELQFTGDRSIAILFTTPDNLVTNDNTYIFTDALIRDGRSLYMFSGGTLFAADGYTSKNLGKTSPSTTYFVVISEDAQVASVYLNGVDYGVITPNPYTAPTGLKLGYGNNINTAFTGVIHSCRLFDYALSAEDVAILWNNGNPAGYMLPNSAALRTGCVAEYLPCGLLSDRWRDTSGEGLDLTASGAPVLSYEEIPSQGEVILDTGVFYTNIAAGTSSKSIALPNGYAITRMSVWNGNSGTLTGVAATLNGGSLFADQSVTADAPLWVVPTTGQAYKSTGNTIAVNATGNTSEGGMRVKVFCKWIGF